MVALLQALLAPEASGAAPAASLSAKLAALRESDSEEQPRAKEPRGGREPVAGAGAQTSAAAEGEGAAAAGGVGYMRTVLVCAPVNVLRNWCDEFEKWVPDSDIEVWSLADAGSSNPKRVRI